MVGETLLHAINCALDAAYEDGRIKRSGIDPQVRELWRWLRLLEAPLHVPPQVPRPVQTIALVMDRETRRRLARACRVTVDWDPPVAMYCGIPIKIDENADGRVYLVSLAPMSEEDPDA